MVDTQVPEGRPGIFFATFVQCLPPSRVIWTLPSSVPTQITLAVLRRLGNGIDGFEFLGVGIVDGQSAGNFLVLPGWDRWS